jgi:pimeloyl-ACP methyl ester carboxylesterase
VWSAVVPAGPGERLDYSVNLHAEDLAYLIRGLGLQRPHIVGLSYGANIALVLATRNPELARSLTLGEPDPVPWLEDTQEGAPLVADYMTKVWEPSKRAFLRLNAQ